MVENRILAWSIILAMSAPSAAVCEIEESQNKPKWHSKYAAAQAQGKKTGKPIFAVFC